MEKEHKLIDLMFAVNCDFCGKEFEFTPEEFKVRWMERTCDDCKKDGAPSQAEDKWEQYEKQAKEYSTRKRRNRRRMAAVRVERERKADRKARRLRRNRRRDKEQGSPPPSLPQS